MKILVAKPVWALWLQLYTRHLMYLCVPLGLERQQVFQARPRLCLGLGVQSLVQRVLSGGQGYLHRRRTCVRPSLLPALQWLHQPAGGNHKECWRDVSPYANIGVFLLSLSKQGRVRHRRSSSDGFIPIPEALPDPSLLYKFINAASALKNTCVLGHLCSLVLVTVALLLTFDHN